MRITARTLTAAAAALLTAALTVLAAGTVAATSGICPDGTEHHYKIDDLDGPTFTVPTPPPDWEIVAVSIKTGRDHHLYQPVTPGQVLDVKTDTGHDVSHAHICKRREPSPSTTAPPATTTALTQPSTSTSSTTPTTTPGSSTSSIPATTTPAPEITSTSTPPTSTSTSSVPQSNTSVDTTAPPPPTHPVLTTSSPAPTPELPVTGGDTTARIIIVAGILVLAGLALLKVRR